MADDSMLIKRDGDTVQITSDRILVSDAIERVSSPGCGATSMFLGTTRNVHDGQKVIRLEYEAHVPMASRQILSLCAAARSEWPSVAKVSVAHRTGVVPVTEPSVVIAVSSPHRKESLAAVAFLIDGLKANVAIWKKEVYDDGQMNWKENSECRWKSLN